MVAALGHEGEVKEDESMMSQRSEMSQTGKTRVGERKKW